MKMTVMLVVVFFVNLLPFGLLHMGWVVGGAFVALRFALYVISAISLIAIERRMVRSAYKRDILFYISIFSISLSLMFVVSILIQPGRGSDFALFVPYLFISSPLSLLTIWFLILTYTYPGRSLLWRLYGWGGALFVAAPAILVMLIPPLPMII